MAGCLLTALLTRYKDFSEDSIVITWLWQNLQSFSTDDKMLFLRFISGRSRLPAHVHEISQRFQISKAMRVGFVKFSSLILSFYVVKSRIFLNVKTLSFDKTIALKWCFSFCCDFVGERLTSHRTDLFLSAAVAGVFVHGSDGREAALCHSKLSVN